MVTGEGRRILVRMPNWVGDVCLTLPFFRGIRRRHPGAEITALARPPLTDLARLFGADRVVGLNDRIPGAIDRARRFVTISSEIRRERYDVAYNLPHSPSSVALLSLARVPVRIGYAEWPTAALLTRPRPWSRWMELHRTRSFYELLEIGEETFVTDSRTLEIPAALAEEGRTVFPGPVERPLIGFGFGSMAPSRRWPLPYFGRLAARLHENGYQVVLFGSQAEREQGEEIRNRSGADVWNLAGRSTLTQTIGAMSHLTAMVANDSGAAHLAGMSGAPTVVFFGAGDPAETSPLGRYHMLRRELFCSPCKKKICPYGLECLVGIEPEEVVEAVGRILRPS